MLARRIGEVLHYIWDPLGVADQPGARDEYDSYVPEATRLALLSDREGLIAFLDRTAAATMGMPQPRAHTEEVAELLLHWKAHLNGAEPR